MRVQLPPYLKTGVILSLVFHLVLLVVTIFFIFQNQHEFSSTIFKKLWNAWDGNTYVYLAEHGYTHDREHAGYIVFYPLYPILVSVASLGFLELHLSALLLTLTGSIIGHTVFYIFLRERGLNAVRAIKVLLLLFLCPATIYFTLVCTEGVFLAWISLFFLYLYRKKYLLAILFGVLASATRFVGITLIVPYVIFLWEHKQLTRRWYYLPLGTLISGGFLLYLWINWRLYADPFHYQGVLATVWHKSVTNPVTNYVHTFSGIVSSYPSHLPTYGIDLLSTLVAPILIGIYVLVKKKKSWWVGVGFALANLYIISSQSYWLSNTRYVSLILPLYVMLEELTSRFKFLYLVVVILFAWLAIQGIDIFSKGGWLY